MGKWGWDVKAKQRPSINDWPQWAEFEKLGYQRHHQLTHLARIVRPKSGGIRMRSVWVVAKHPVGMNPMEAMVVGMFVPRHLEMWTGAEKRDITYSFTHTTFPPSKRDRKTPAVEQQMLLIMEELVVWDAMENAI